MWYLLQLLLAGESAGLRRKKVQHTIWALPKIQNSPYLFPNNTCGKIIEGQAIHHIVLGGHAEKALTDDETKPISLKSKFAEVERRKKCQDR